jgi:hypothetical protein
MALQDVGDRNARAFWLSLFPGAVQPYQREALELALAIDEEHSGRLDLIFAPDSQVRHPIIREILLEEVAGPAILRQQSSRPAVPKIEREIALYTLLSKDLERGFYRDFLGDVRLLPTDATAEGGGYYGGANMYDARWNPDQSRPPLALFGTAAKLGDFGCPALTATVSQLAGNPAAIRPRLCFAEFVRRNDFDWFNESSATEEQEGAYRVPQPAPGHELAASREQFPAGTPYARLEVYKAIMNDPAASADDKALALNRAVRCYAPSGNNSCGGTEVKVAQRKAWYDRLKAQYPDSRWAKELKFYW